LPRKATKPATAVKVKPAMAEGEAITAIVRALQPRGTSSTVQEVLDKVNTPDSPATLQRETARAAVTHMVKNGTILRHKSGRIRLA